MPATVTALVISSATAAQRSAWRTSPVRRRAATARPPSAAPSGRRSPSPHAQRRRPRARCPRPCGVAPGAGQPTASSGDLLILAARSRSPAAAEVAQRSAQVQEPNRRASPEHGDICRGGGAPDDVTIAPNQRCQVANEAAPRDRGQAARASVEVRQRMGARTAEETKRWRRRRRAAAARRRRRRKSPSR